ncbi:hypothetical protein SDC9_85851 [bioreactor metagenome]|uniref:Uncharacterized protein n=1 Tax=bioreactor metagenome TaxID=1076179 RepID=A0A644ZFY2_9ZZZZ
MVQNARNRALGHEHFRNVVVDGEDALNDPFGIAQVNGARFEDSTVPRFGQVAEFVGERLVVFALDGFQHNARGAAACLPVGYMAVLDHRDGMLGVVA